MKILLGWIAGMAWLAMTCLVFIWAVEQSMFVWTMVFFGWLSGWIALIVWMFTR